jgi:AcrR family transcriptional regulator
MIFAALRECIIEKGYSTTTLADIAREAGMSPSHLLYYFSDKADILAQYFASVSQRITARLEEFRAETPEHRIDLLARLFFGGKGLSKTEIGFMLECFGVAVHLPSLKQHKSDLDALCKSYLRDLFAELGTVSGDPAYAAEVAYALLVGLRTAVYFDENLSVEQAHQIFRTEMMKMVSRRAGERRTRLSASAAR